MNELILTPVPVDDLCALIAESVASKLEERKRPEEPTAPPPAPDDLVTRTEAAAILHVSLPSLHGMCRRGILTPVRVEGVRRTLFRRADVLAALEGRCRR